MGFLKVAPTLNALKEAEKLVEKLGIAEALERRYARFEEIQGNLIWKQTLNGLKQK